MCFDKSDGHVDTTELKNHVVCSWVTLYKTHNLEPLEKYIPRGRACVSQKSGNQLSSFLRAETQAYS